MKRKIIFTDFLGTLVPENLKAFSDKTVSSQEEDYVMIQNFLNEYLFEQNLMYILTSVAHSSKEIVFKTCDVITSKVDKEKLKYLQIYLVGEKGKYEFIADYELPETGFIIKHRVGEKETIVEHLIEKLNVSNTDYIISAGNSVGDINMLFKVHNIGGISYYIGKYFFNLAANKDINELINSIAYWNATSNITSKEELIKFEWQEAYYAKIKDLLEQYNTGIINREQLEYMYAVLNINDSYSLNIHLKNSTEYVNDIEKKLVLVRDRKDILDKFRN